MLKKRNISGYYIAFISADIFYFDYAHNNIVSETTLVR